MSKGFWDDEPFRDGAPQFEQGQWKEPETYTPAPDTVIRAKKLAQEAALRQEQEEDEEPVLVANAEAYSEDGGDDDEDFSDILSDARLRLEQGKLYEMIINHDLFSGVDADPRAARVVQKQMRNFAKLQMEILLGMRQESAEPTKGMVSSPFNSLEVKILKIVASKASNGASEMEEEEDEEYVAPAPKKKTLNTIGSNKPKQQPKPQPKPVTQKKVEPIKRQAKQVSQLPPEMEPDYEPLNKPIHQMTAQELAERDRQALERQKSRQAASPKDRAPMPDYATQEMLAMTQAARATSAVSGMAGLNGKLSTLILNNAIKKV
jgi:hypothetical protein